MSSGNSWVFRKLQQARKNVMFSGAATGGREQGRCRRQLGSGLNSAEILPVNLYKPLSFYGPQFPYL